MECVKTVLRIDPENPQALKLRDDIQKESKSSDGCDLASSHADVASVECSLGGHRTCRCRRECRIGVYVSEIMYSTPESNKRSIASPERSERAIDEAGLVVMRSRCNLIADTFHGRHVGLLVDFPIALHRHRRGGSY